MLKTRLIPTILVNGRMLVQSIGFRRYLPVGKPKIAVEFFNRWDVDEIIVLDITPGREAGDSLVDLTAHISGIAFIPLTVGGGIRDINQIERLLQSGADKISINTAAVLDRPFLAEAARTFGCQDIVVSIDVKNTDQGREVMIHGGKKGIGLDPVSWAQEVEQLGAGEILLNSVDRDGSKEGYDTTLIRDVVNAVSIPVIALGGVGQMDHFPAAALEGGADAVSAANIFHYVEHSTILAKAALKKAGVNVRLVGSVNYDDNGLPLSG